MTSPRVLVDTGAWLGAFFKRDQYHGAAAALLRRLRAERTQLVVTDLILAETHLHLLRSLGPAGGAAHLETIKADPLVEEVFATRDLQAAALSDWIRRFEDQAFTLTDAVSFAVMRAHRVNSAFTFDQHFRTAGFETLPD